MSSATYGHAHDAPPLHERSQRRLELRGARGRLPWGPWSAPTLSTRSSCVPPEQVLAGVTTFARTCLTAVTWLGKEPASVAQGTRWGWLWRASCGAKFPCVPTTRCYTTARAKTGAPTWGYSSAGRARDWQSRGQGFEPPYLHHEKPQVRGLKASGLLCLFGSMDGVVQHGFATSCTDSGFFAPCCFVTAGWAFATCMAVSPAGPALSFRAARRYTAACGKHLNGKDQLMKMKTRRGGVAS